MNNFFKDFNNHFKNEFCSQVERTIHLRKKEIESFLDY
jgi:hypothetical protein